MTLKERALGAIDDAFNDQVQQLFKGLHLNSLSEPNEAAMARFRRGFKNLLTDYVIAQDAIKASFQ